MKKLFARVSGNIEDGFIINNLSSTRDLYGVWVELRKPADDGLLKQFYNMEEGDTIAVCGSFSTGLSLCGLLKLPEDFQLPSVEFIKLEDTVVQNFRRWSCDTGNKSL